MGAHHDVVLEPPSPEYGRHSPRCDQVTERDHTSSPLRARRVPMLRAEHARALEQPRPPEELAQSRLLDQPPARELLCLTRPRRVQEQLAHEALGISALGRIPALAHGRSDRRDQTEGEAGGKQPVGVLGAIQTKREPYIAYAVVLRDGTLPLVDRRRGPALSLGAP